MTTLPERLQDVIVEFRRIAKDHEIKADRPHQDDSTRQWHMGTAEAYDDAADRLEAAQALQAAPEGGEWVLVPHVPTPEMIEAGIMFGTSPNKATIIFQSMCNAAPSPTAALQAGEV